MSDKSTRIVDRLWKKLERLIGDDDPQPSDFEHISEEAEMYAKDFQDSDLWHVAGLAWYVNPKESQMRSTKIYELEGHALEINADNQFARQYLAYHQFDEGLFEEALSNFELLDTAFFEDRSQQWRLLKNRELILTSRLYLEKTTRIDEFEDLFDNYLEAANKGEESVPIELGDCLVSLCQSGSKPDIDLLKKFEQLVFGLGYEAELNEQLRTLRQYS